jgi:quercetin dioxygenase-like cupin family protein
MSVASPIFRSAGEGEKRWFFGGGEHTWKLTSEETSGALFLMEDCLSQGKTTPWHSHPEADEVIYVIEGEILSRLGDEERRVGPGGVTFAPRGTPHAFTVLSETATVLALQTPGTGDAFYRGASGPIAEGGGVDVARLMASAQENGGIEILGPPPFQPA